MKINLRKIRKLLWELPIVKEYLLSRKIQKINRKEKEHRNG